MSEKPLRFRFSVSTNADTNSATAGSAGYVPHDHHGGKTSTSTPSCSDRINIVARMDEKLLFNGHKRLVLIREVSDCDIRIIGNPGSLTLFNVSQSRICVFGSNESKVNENMLGVTLLAYELSNVTLEFYESPLQQVRLHDSRSINIHADCINPGIIEECTDLHSHPGLIFTEDHRLQYYQWVQSALDACYDINHTESSRIDAHSRTNKWRSDSLCSSYNNPDFNDLSNIVTCGSRNFMFHR